jgi:hypothetical protein
MYCTGVVVMWGCIVGRANTVDNCPVGGVMFTGMFSAVSY